MATSASTPRPDPRGPAGPSRPKPDVRDIMTGIRRAAHERGRPGAGGEHDFRADLRKRMMQPLSGRNFTEDFIKQMRSRAARWNIGLASGEFHGSSGGPTRLFRVLLRPLVRLAVNLRPAARMAARQAEINEYHHRLLWATNRDLEITRRELDLLKSELGRLGVHAQLPIGSGGKDSAAAPARRSRRTRGGGPDRGRGGRRRGRPRPRGRPDRGRPDRGRPGRGRPGGK